MSESHYTASPRGSPVYLAPADSTYVAGVPRDPRPTAGLGGKLALRELHGADSVGSIAIPVHGLDGAATAVCTGVTRVVSWPTAAREERHDPLWEYATACSDPGRAHCSWYKVNFIRDAFPQASHVVRGVLCSVTITLKSTQQALVGGRRSYHPLP